MVRAFTNNGFRDTEPVFIEIEMGSDVFLMRLSIVCTSVGLMLLVSTMIVVYCYMDFRKRQKLQTNEELTEAVQSDDDLLTFTSYCAMASSKPKVHDE
jgi:hypothetical protein